MSAESLIIPYFGTLIFSRLFAMYADMAITTANFASSAGCTVAKPKSSHRLAPLTSLPIIGTKNTPMSVSKNAAAYIVLFLYMVYGTRDITIIAAMPTMKYTACFFT